MTTPQELRESASRIRQGAYHADRTSDMRRELAQAEQLELQAKKLEEENTKTEERRKKLVAKVKIAQQQLGMDDDAYRDLLQSETGKRSATKLKVWELENVLKRMRKLGFKDKAPKQAGSRPMARDDQSRLIRSLWLQLHEAGKVRDPSERALANWARTRCYQGKVVSGAENEGPDVDALQWMTSAQLGRLIEQLKKWLAR